MTHRNIIQQKDNVLHVRFQHPQHVDALTPAPDSEAAAPLPCLWLIDLLQDLADTAPAGDSPPPLQPRTLTGV